jgi:hypothetical protein
MTEHPPRAIPVGKLVALATAALLFAGGAAGAIDGDLLHELALFREILASGRIPTTDSFAFTPTVEPVVHHEWGFGALAYAMIASFGAPGILILKFVGIAVLAILAWREARARGASPAMLALCAPFAAMLTWSAFATVRAHLATLLGIVALFTILRRDAKGSRRAWLAWIPLQLVWQNLHGGFVAGVALLALHVAERTVRTRRLPPTALALAASGLIVLVNPWGADYPAYLWRALRMDRPLITEWNATFSEFSPIAVLLAVALLSIGYALVRRGARDLDGLPIVLFTALEATLHQRFAPLFAVSAFVYLPGWLTPTPLGIAARVRFERHRFAIAYAAVVVALPMFAQAVNREFWRVRVPAFSHDRREHIYPVGAIDYLREQGARANVLTAFGDGSYVTWKLHPAVNVSLDSRYEVAYRDGVLEEHQDFFGGKDRDLALPDRYGADLILAPQRSPVVELLATSTNWRRCYVDDSYSLFQRALGPLPDVDRRGERFEGEFP